MSEMPMVERVARALCEAMGSDPDWTGYQSGPTDDARPIWMRREKEARAAIRSMRMTHLPGEGMRTITAKRVWNAGIDAALAVPEEGREP